MSPPEDRRIRDAKAHETLARHSSDRTSWWNPEAAASHWKKAAQLWAAVGDRRRGAQAARELAGAADRWADELDAEAEKAEKKERF